jgi:hypothetical protein
MLSITNQTISLVRYTRGMKFKLIRSPNPKKKWRGVFTDDEGKETHTDFGDATMRDYTQHGNPLRRAGYLARHRANENWNDPQTAGALSRWILWETPNLQTNVRRFRQRFRLA